MVRRVILLACAGILVFSMSACGKSQEAAKHQIEGSHVVSAESSVSAQEPEELSEAEPELPQDDEEITGAVEQIQDGTEEPQPEQNVTQPEGNQQSEQSQTVERGTVNYADRQEIYLDSSWQYADHSAIHYGCAVMYKASENRNGIVVGVNAGHGTSGGSSVKTLCHPDGSAKTTGGSTAAGATKATAVSGGMTFADGASESSVTLRMAQILRDKLLAAGYDVLMVRDGSDVQLDNVARTVICNNVADCHISLHWDGDGLNYDKGSFYISVPDGVKGMEPVASHWTQHNALGASLVDGLRAQGCKINGGGSMSIDLTQTSYSTIPSVDMELGNACSNHSDETLNIQAEGLLHGINAYYGR